MIIKRHDRGKVSFLEMLCWMEARISVMDVYHHLLVYIIIAGATAGFKDGVLVQSYQSALPVAMIQ